MRSIYKGGQLMKKVHKLQEKIKSLKRENQELRDRIFDMVRKIKKLEFDAMIRRIELEVSTDMRK